MIIPVAVVLIAAGAGAGLAYQWGLDSLGTRRVPYLLVAGMAFLCGMGGWSAATLSKCRAPLIGAGVGLLVGLSAITGSHVVKYRQAVAAGAPAAVGENFTWRAAQGIGGRAATATRTARASKYRGGMAKAAWWAEGALLCIAGVIGGVVASCRPFCEQCGRYAGAEHWSLREECPPAHAVKALKAAESVPGLYRQEWDGSGDKESSLVFAVRVCPRCAGVPTLTVTHIKKGGGSWWLAWVIGWVAWLWSSDSSSELHSGVLLSDEELDEMTEWAAARPGFTAAALDQVEAVGDNPAL